MIPGFLEDSLPLKGVCRKRPFAGRKVPFARERAGRDMRVDPVRAMAEPWRRLSAHAAAAWRPAEPPGVRGCPARGALSWIAAQPSGDGLGRIWTPNGRLEGVEPMIEPVGRPSAPTMDGKGRTATRTEPKQRRGQA